MDSNEKYGFFDAMATESGYDRIYSSSDVATLVSLLVRTGVFAIPDGQLKVSSGGGLTLNVSPGAAIIDGRYYILPEEKDITVSLNNSSATKKIYVCCTLNMSTRKIEIVTREQGSDVLPVNNGTIHELILCEFDLGVGISVITNSMLTDRRADDQYCGWVRGIAEMDSKLLNMITELTGTVAANKEAVINSINSLSTTVANNKKQTDASINSLSNTVSSNKTNIENQIGDLDDKTTRNIKTLSANIGNVSNIVGTLTSLQNQYFNKNTLAQYVDLFIGIIYGISIREVTITVASGSSSVASMSWGKVQLRVPRNQTVGSVKYMILCVLGIYPNNSLVMSSIERVSADANYVTFNASFYNTSNSAFSITSLTASCLCIQNVKK